MDRHLTPVSQVFSNHLSSLPAEIGQLTQLERLDVRNSKWWVMI